MARFRHGVGFDLTAPSSTWARLLNVPAQAVPQATPESPARPGSPGYVLVVATDAIVAIRVTVRVENEDMVTYDVAAPGEPARIPVGIYGVTLEYRMTAATEYGHNPGTGLPNVNNEPSPRIQAAYLPGESVPVLEPRRVWDRRTVPGQLWGSATYRISVPLGAPGIYRVLRARVFRSNNGAAPQATAVNSVYIECQEAAQGRDLACFRNSATTPAGSCLPFETADQGGAHQRFFQSLDGYAELVVTLDSAPDAGEEWTFWQCYEYAGPSQLAPSLSVIQG